MAATLIEKLLALGHSPGTSRARRWVPLDKVLDIIRQHQAEQPDSLEMWQQVLDDAVAYRRLKAERPDGVVERLLFQLDSEAEGLSRRYRSTSGYIDPVRGERIKAAVDQLRTAIMTCGSKELIETLCWYASEEAYRTEGRVGDTVYDRLQREVRVLTDRGQRARTVLRKFGVEL